MLKRRLNGNVITQFPFIRNLAFSYCNSQDLLSNYNWKGVLLQQFTRPLCSDRVNKNYNVNKSNLRFLLSPSFSAEQSASNQLSIKLHLYNRCRVQISQRYKLRILSNSVREVSLKRQTSCLNGLDSTKQVNLYLIKYQLNPNKKVSVLFYIQTQAAHQVTQQKSRHYRLCQKVSKYVSIKSSRIPTIQVRLILSD